MLVIHSEKLGGGFARTRGLGPNRPSACDQAPRHAGASRSSQIRSTQILSPNVLLAELVAAHGVLIGPPWLTGGHGGHLGCLPCPPAVADLLAGVGRRAPLIVVIEDGHWADTPTLLLLRHLARGVSDARALVVTTLRDTEAEVPEALSAALVDLRQSAAFPATCACTSCTRHLASCTRWHEAQVPTW